MSAEDPGRFQAAVFDLDGTLVDSETRSHESWRQCSPRGASSRTTR